MNFAQTIPFNVSKGGKVPDMCLDNVCKGYGIANKYDSAWEAWEHTQQHTDAIPEGLAVPLYYSYTTTIKGITQNYGHINVRLPDGTVWSDGNIYASIEDYTSQKLPKFVGWGESINDVNIIKGEPMNNELPFNLGDAQNIANLLGVPVEAIQNAKNWNDAWYKATAPRVQELKEQLAQALANPPGVTPYSGPELFTKS